MNSNSETNWRGVWIAVWVAFKNHQYPTMRALHLPVIALIAGLANAKDASRHPNLGPEWFARLRNPETRIAALYQYEKASAVKGQQIDDPEKFAADHRETRIFRCPQPGLPNAWVVLELGGWQAGQDVLCGPDPKIYEPHPLEVERRRLWRDADNHLPPDFKPWQVGQPWFEQASGFLVDESGKQLDEGFFGSPAILADFDSDGCLDLLEFSRVHLDRGNKQDATMDCVSIGPLIATQPRQLMFYCNQRTDVFERSKAWRFMVRRDPQEVLQLVLVPTDKAQQEIIYQFQKEKGGFVASTDKFPEGILVDAHPKAEEYDAMSSFLEAHGYSFGGVGSDGLDGAGELDANLPAPPIRRGGEMIHNYEWKLPETGSLPPRAAAQAMATHQLGNLHQTHYELASLGDPTPPATSGWLERWCDGGGWGHESVTVWWFLGPSAQQWTQKDDNTFMVSEVSPAELGRRIAIAHEIDRVRTVPTSPHARMDDHKRIGGDDIPSYRVRALSTAPAALATVFDPCIPSLWESVGARYDRDLASVIATNFVDPIQADAKPQAIRDLARIWLDPAKFAEIPPPLIRAVVLSAGENKWQETKPQLVKLQAALGPSSKGEFRLTEIDDAIRKYYNTNLHLKGRDEWMAKRNYHALEREKHKLVTEMTGNPGYELRATVETSLKNLKKK